MLTILLTSLILSLAIMGLWICFNWRGMIFEPIAYALEGFFYRFSIPHYIAKPLWACPTCMSSVWGLIFYAFYGHTYLSFVAICLVILSIAFLNTLWCIFLNKNTEEGC